MEVMYKMVFSFFKKKEESVEEIKDKLGYNPYLISEIQPMGNIKFEERYIKKGDGYETCIFIYDYKTIVSDFWLEPIMNMEGVIPTLDIASTSRFEVVRDINKAMAEQDTRYQNAKDNVDRMDAEKAYNGLKEMYEMVDDGEVIKRVVLRVYVYAKTFSELEIKTKEVLNHLESYNFRGTVLLNEQQYEWESLVTGYNTQMEYPNKRNGKEIPSQTLAGGNFLHFTSLADPYGSHYGTTDTNGTVIFDLFHKDSFRKFYNGLVIGKMGTGKSTLLKKLVKDNAIKGYKVRVLDVTGEFTGLVESLEGKTIALDGSEGLINILQVFKTVLDDEGNVEEGLSFTQHLSKMSVFYKYIKNNASHNEVIEFENLLRKLYISKGMWSSDPNVEMSITSHKSSEYPILSDLLSLVEKELYEDVESKKLRENLSRDRESRLLDIELSLANLIENYGHIFNGVSSIEDFDKELVVSFPLRNLLNLKPEIFQAQIFNLMNMLWDGMIVNGEHQLKNFTNNNMSFEDAQRYLIVLDEAYNIINTEDTSQPAVKYITQFMREARKYFGGIVFASHLLTDFVPMNSSQTNAENVKKLFQLTQYKFIGEQDIEALPQIKSVFEGQLTESEIKVIPTLVTGNMVLSISSVKNIVFTVDVSEEELKLFGGGA